MDSKVRTSKIYDVQSFIKLTDGLKVAACMISDSEPVVDESSSQRHVVPLTLGTTLGNTCRSCGGVGPFSSRALQLQHYGSLWHTLNLHRRLLGKNPVTFKQWKAQEDGVPGSSSESESDSDEQSKKGPGEVSDLFLAATRHCRAYFTNRQGEVLSVYRCLLHHKKEPIGLDGVGDAWVSSCQELVKSRGWAVLMSAGGRFAGALFHIDNGQPFKSKTFNSYITRRGQGKVQSTRDNRGNAPRSAGASLRRYNQEQYCLHVKELLTSWKEDLAVCSLILYRAAGPLNHKALFGPGSPLDKKDQRLRTLPFPTKRASHKELLRSHGVLSTVEIYENAVVFQKALGTTNKNANNNQSDKTSCRRPSKPSPVKLDRAKSRELTPRELPEETPFSSEDEAPTFQPSTCPANWTETLANYDKSIKKPTKDLLRHESDEDKTPKVVQVTKKLNNLDITGTLEEFDDSVKRKPKKPKKKNHEKLKGSETKLIQDKVKSSADENKKLEDDANSKLAKAGKVTVKISPLVEKLWQEVQTGGAALELLLDRWDEPLGLAEALNTSDPKDGNTALHKAAIAEQCEVVTQLLKLGADPCCRNQSLHTPYSATTNPQTRVAFRLFQGLYPDKYNYSKANIPGPLTAEALEQEMEKKAAQKRAKRQKDKDKLQEKTRINKFAELNDAEKRAAVCEKRCFSCGIRIEGYPFEYDECKFCSVKCLQNHRITRPLKLSNRENH